MNFKEINVIDPIVKATALMGYTHPTEIQQKAIPVILEGRDVIGCAQTGTGKTAAFAIPTLQLLHNHPKKQPVVRVLVITPTRELAMQVHENYTTYSEFLTIRSQVIVGGVPHTKQLKQLQQKPAVIIGTVGRLLDLIQSGHIQLSYIETVVLDEADTMLDMGFIKDIQKILAMLPKQRQTLFFSATLPHAIKKFALTILKNPIEIAVTPVSSTGTLVTQKACYLPQDEKRKALVAVLKKYPQTQTLVFTRTKRGANRLIQYLEKIGIQGAAIHGNKSQNTRLRALQSFKDGLIDVLVATDIAARGIDIEGLPLVINYEIPNVPETYVHRIGRTGRAGMEGIAISFCNMDEKAYIRAIEKLIGSDIPEYEVSAL
ncbi:ATP-dependent RNA helicase RhlE [Pustulibacterium marinum]|uniref:ATP-dependent RNA helicase RhlE n=1 Tax=Pustulibacterium marinum TaxID=1224947 RepID=A0A1I7GXD6_9FLAO|nr:DEAD/DEAH box helicase [Pustulibacterium marinum]SFU53118.1 ATP-dependent RNA helicase RhlE [Pustulibacterium marinum]